MTRQQQILATQLDATQRRFGGSLVVVQQLASRAFASELHIVDGRAVACSRTNGSAGTVKFYAEPISIESASAREAASEPAFAHELQGAWTKPL